MAPVNDPALHGTNAESLRTDTINDEEAITANVEDKSLNAALTISSTAADQNNGKGTDSELYDVNPLEGGNTEKRRVDRSEDFDTAQSLLQLRYLENEVDAAFVLVDLRAKFYKSENESDPLYSSETEDEGPPLSTDRKIRFCTYCNGSQVQLSAHEGDAVLAILSLRSLPRAFIPEIYNGEARCRRCFNILGSLHARYIHRYRELGWERFEREETVPLDDDTVDSPDHERDGATVYDGERDRGEMLPSPPKLSRTTLERLEKEKREWRPEPDLPTVTSADTSVSVTKAVETIQPSLYAKESNVRGSVSHPEATAEHTANDASPPSQRPSYTSLRSGDSFPRPSVSVDPTRGPSSLLPFTQQARQTKPVTPSPLKQVSNAAEVTQMSPSPERHNVPTRPSLQRLLGTWSTYNPFGSVQASPDRAEPTNEPVHLRGGDIAPARAQQPGSVTPTNEAPLFGHQSSASRFRYNQYH